MAIAHVDSNRGNDTTGDGSINNPFKSLSKVANWNGANAGGILLARDSVFDIAITKAANGQVALTSAFNGTSGQRCFIDAYDPPGVGSLTSKPTIRRRMFPTASDWQWDATDNFGYPKGWYIQFSFAAAFWDARVVVAGQLAETTNQNTDSNTGQGYINGTKNGPLAGQFVNGMTRNTLRFNFDYSGASVGGQTGARLYLSGTGLNTPGAGNDPSSVVGPNAIEISFGSVFSLYDAGNYCDIANLRCETGSGLMTYQGTADTVRQGLNIHDIEHYDTSIPFRFNSGTATQANNRWDIDIHHCRSDMTTGPSFTAYGAGIVGSYRDNEFNDGNRASSMGGGVYMQVKASLQGGVRTPFKVLRNVARRWKNGAGNNEFDGSCYYVDLHDDGTIIEANLAHDSFVAFQCGSGRRYEAYSNIAVNCEQFFMLNNAASVDFNDYRVANNLFVAAARGTFPHGDTANVHEYHMPAYQVGNASNLVGIQVSNNVFINNPANTSEVPLLLGSSANWDAGKVSAKNNLFIGYGSRLVDADFGSANKTSSATSLPALTVTGFKALNDFRLTAVSGLVSAGVDVNRTGALDADGNSYCSPPSVGPYEMPRLLNYFSRPVQI